MQGSYLKALQFTQQLLIFAKFHTEFGGNLRLRGRAAGTHGQGPDRLFNGSPFAPKIPRAPIQSSQTVENVPSNTKLRITAKLHLLLRIKLPEGINQTQDPADTRSQISTCCGSRSWMRRARYRTVGSCSSINSSCSGLSSPNCFVACTDFSAAVATASTEGWISSSVNFPCTGCTVFSCTPPRRNSRFCISFRPPEPLSLSLAAPRPV